MRQVSQAEAIATLPTLLQEVNTHIVVIRDRETGNGLGALISMEDLQIVRQVRLAHLSELRDQAYQTIKANAEARGENVEEVLDELLKDV